jgi:NAD(P)-dependent dehydrogenase (short-subunit alcohol dehydrogenase family)
MSSNEKPAAIVTGASSGIGLGIAQALLEHAYRVVGTSRFVTSNMLPSATALRVSSLNFSDQKLDTSVLYTACRACRLAPLSWVDSVFEVE